MFFQIELQHELVVHPQFFGPKIRQTIKQLLYEEVEGTSSGKYGYIIAVTEIIDIGRGYLHQHRGLATFLVKYRAIVLRPFRGEVVDALVSQVTKLGFFASVGPLSIFVARSNMPQNMTYIDSEKMFRSDDEEFTTLSQGDDVRIRIISTRRDFKETFAIGILLRIRDTYMEELVTDPAMM